MADVVPLPVRAVPAAVDRMLGTAETAGIRSGDPDAAFVDCMADVALSLDGVLERLEGQINRADRAVSADTEQSLRRVAGQALERAARAVVLGRRWRDLAALAGSVVVALGVGAWCGWAGGYATASQRTAWAATELQGAFHGGLPGAQWLASMAQLNDPTALAEECRQTFYRTDAGGQACAVHLWVVQPKISTRGQ